MAHSNIWIAPHLRVLIADTDEAYRASLRTQLVRLKFRTIDETATPQATLTTMQGVPYDIAMVEVAPLYRPVWAALRDARDDETLVVGMSLDRSGHDWIDAIRQGANAILMKAFHVYLLQPVLAHMLASPAAHRCRIVQFPRPEAMKTIDGRPSRRFDSKDARDR